MKNSYSVVLVCVIILCTLYIGHAKTFAHERRGDYGNGTSNMKKKIEHQRYTPLLPPNTLQRLRDRRFGLYSYYDTITNESNTNILIEFINTYNIAFINQYSCMSYTPSQYANFVNAVTSKTNATVHVLFDDTVSNNPSKCGIQCKRGHSTGKGWCCGSIDLKFQCTYNDFLRHIYIYIFVF